MTCFKASLLYQTFSSSISLAVGAIKIAIIAYRKPTIHNLLNSECGIFESDTIRLKPIKLFLKKLLDGFENEKFLVFFLFRITAFTRIP